MSAETEVKTQDLGALKVMYSEMSDADEAQTIEICMNVMRNTEKNEKVTYYKDIAQTIKEDMDKEKGGMWNVVIGRSFGSFVTHETKTIVYFYLGNVGFFVWRHG